MIVVDANVVLVACLSAHGFEPFRRESLVAPSFMWAEARSGLHEALWRGDIAREAAEGARARLDQTPVRPRSHRRLGATAWDLANRFGWAKTYDAEYVALASLLGCKLVTLDAGLRRATDRLGFVIGPDEL